VSKRGKGIESSLPRPRKRREKRKWGWVLIAVGGRMKRKGVRDSATKTEIKKMKEKGSGSVNR